MKQAIEYVCGVSGVLLFIGYILLCNFALC